MREIGVTQDHRVSLWFQVDRSIVLPNRLNNFNFPFQHIIDQIRQLDTLGVSLGCQIGLHTLIEVNW